MREFLGPALIDLNPAARIGQQIGAARSEHIENGHPGWSVSHIAQALRTQRDIERLLPGVRLRFERLIDFGVLAPFDILGSGHGILRLFALPE